MQAEAVQIEADWLRNTRAQRVLQVLDAAGHGAYFVGGCVRNALLGCAATDIDIATDARPDRVTHLMDEAGIRTVPTGIDHGTVTAIIDGNPFEITTFRRDVETDGRRAVVAFADTITEDARRRDFTMNALYAAHDGTVIDPLGGLPDLQARRVRFIEDAAERIAEDHLRTLRFFRFHAWYGDPDAGPDAEALAAIAASLDGLERLSKERIGSEMRKLLSAPDPVQATAAMERAGVLARVLPGADARLLGPVVLLEASASLPPDWLRRLLALGGQNQKELLRLSKPAARRLQDFNAAIGLPLTEAAYRFGQETAWDCALLGAAAGQSPLPPDTHEEIEAGAKARFPISARDLPELSGKTLGDRLRVLEVAWIKSGFVLSRADLLALP